MKKNIRIFIWKLSVFGGEILNINWKAIPKFINGSNNKRKIRTDFKDKALLDFKFYSYKLTDKFFPVCFREFSLQNKNRGKFYAYG